MIKAKSQAVCDLCGVFGANIQAFSSTTVEPGSVPEESSRLETRWVRFDEEMEAFNEMIDIQKESLKAHLEDQVIEASQNIDRFADRWHALKPRELMKWDISTVGKVVEEMEEWHSQLEDLEQRLATLVEHFTGFDMPNPPRFDGLADIAGDIAKSTETWIMLKEYKTALFEMSKQDWISFRSNVFALQDLATTWTTKFNDHVSVATIPELLNAAKKDDDSDGKESRVTKKLSLQGKSDANTTVAAHVAVELDLIKAAIPALKYCTGNDFKDEHWSSLLQSKLGLPQEVRLENLTVGHFILSLEKLADPGLAPFMKQLQAKAQGEVLIREALRELAVWSQTAVLTLVDDNETSSSSSPLSGASTVRTTRNKPKLIKDWKDIFLELGDKQSLIASLKESPFYRSFEDVGSSYEAKLGTLDFTLRSLNSIQRKWVYLAPIFDGGALPSERKRFKHIDVDFCDVMAKVATDPKLFALADDRIHPNLRRQMEEMVEQLEWCQKKLCDFLEEKRNGMPRLFFLGDEALLEILGQSSNVFVIQTHLKELFQGVARVVFNDVKCADDQFRASILQMQSARGELVTLDKPVATSDSIEEWLAMFATQMQSTLSQSLNTYLAAINGGGAGGSSSSMGSYDEFPSQVLCLGENIGFADAVECAIDGRSFAELKASLQDQLSFYTSYSGLSHVLQTKIKALIMDVIHNMDVLEQLDHGRCASVDDWVWVKQLRYYVSDSQGVIIRMSADAQFGYTYEYQGNAPKLVHTPLTDKCFLTLTQGMHMGFGGNPYGPAGTG